MKTEFARVDDLPSSDFEQRVAVLVPCYNEESTIFDVVTDFKRDLPKADIYVYDNNSSDRTSDRAAAAGAIVRRELRRGKGNVVRRMFCDVDADIYVLVDGDGTYDSAAAPHLIATLVAGPYDQVIGARRHCNAAAYRRGHLIGNFVLSRLVALAFGTQIHDMLSGYRVFSRAFVKSCPVISTGFEIETELFVHALHLDLPMTEIVTDYRERPEGSSSKLSTYKDGLRISYMILQLVRDLLPLQFFGIAGGLLMIISVGISLPLLPEYLRTGLVPRLPTAILSTGIMLVGIFSIFTGLILDNVVKGRREAKLFAYLNQGSGRRARKTC